MKNTNVYARDLESYLKIVDDLKIRRINIKTLASNLNLSSKKLGVSYEPTIEGAGAFLSEYDTVRLEMIERIETSPLLTDPVIAKEIRKAGFKSTEEFLRKAKRELSGEKDSGALKRVLTRGETIREEAKDNGDIFVELDPDMFHPMGRIGESEIEQAINVQTVKQLVRSFR